jgi:integrase
LKAALNRAFREDNKHVNDDSAWRRVTPYRQTDAQRPGFLSLEECQRLIHAADAESGFGSLVHAALPTGARYGELCNVRVRDFVNGKLHIACSKNGRSRNVTLTEEATEFFHELAVGRAGTEFMVLRSGGLPWKRSDQFRPMREACQRARTDPAVGIHQLRHTYCSLLVMSGMPLTVLARNLGHTTTRMVEKFYGHLRDDYATRSGRTRRAMALPSRAM